MKIQTRNDTGSWMLVALLCLFATSGSWADAMSQDDADALKGLTSAKAVFDITTENPKKLSFYLDLVNQMADSMRAQNVEPEFVLTFRGPATFFVSSDRERVKLEEVPIADKIQNQLFMLSHNPNVRLEQCGVAAKALQVDTKTIYPGIKVVGNSWISLVGYQNRGYALVPVR